VKRIALLITVAALAGCGGSSEGDAALETATRSFCGHVAGGVEVVTRLYGETERFAESDFEALEAHARDLEDDAQAFEDLPAVKSDRPDLGPLARELGARATAAAGVLDNGELSTRELFFRLQDYGSEMASIPGGVCEGTRLAGAKARDTVRDLAIKIRCVHVGRITRILERYLREETDKSGKDLDETADGLQTSSRLFAFLGDKRAAGNAGKLAELVEEWARLTRAGERAGHLFERAGALTRTFGRCPEF
jgi:hypothetical protein